MVRLFFNVPGLLLISDNQCDLCSKQMTQSAFKLLPQLPLPDRVLLLPPLQFQCILIRWFLKGWTRFCQPWFGFFVNHREEFIFLFVSLCLIIMRLYNLFLFYHEGGEMLDLFRFPNSGTVLCRLKISFLPPFSSESEGRWASHIMTALDFCRPLYKFLTNDVQFHFILFTENENKRCSKKSRYNVSHVP